MIKNLRKNKKGFTLTEVIVVLLIIGILLAISIPAIMGYVGKAQEAQYIAEGRSGFLAAQTLNASAQAKNTAPTITSTTIAAELGDEDGTITKAACKIANKNITECVFNTKGTGAAKYVYFKSNSVVTVESTLPTGFTATDLN